MADIEVVIKIPEEVRVAITRMGLLRIPDEMQKKVDRAIQRGTPLPKGHGDLKDSNNLKHAFTLWSMAVHGNFTDADIASIIYNSTTIIEADKSESEEAQLKQIVDSCLDFDFDRVKETLKNEDLDNLIVDHTCEEKLEQMKGEADEK